MKYIPIMAVLTALLSGCSGQKIENCWSKETKQESTSIVKSIVEEQVANFIKIRTGMPASPERKKEIASRAKIELTDFYVVNKYPDAERLTCGAMAHFSFEKADNQIVTGETSMEFDVAKGEHGNVVSVSKAPIIMMVNAAE